MVERGVLGFPKHNLAPSQNTLVGTTALHGVCTGKGDIFSVKLAKCFSCVLLISFVNYAECVMCAVCPRYSLHKSNAMLKHCGGSPKWLEAQSLQGTLLQPFRRIERLPINPQAHFTAYQVRACKTLNC